MNDFDGAEIVGIKELHQNMKTISDRALQGVEFIVFKSSKPIFRIIPYRTKKEKGKYTLKDFLKLQTHTGDKNLSKNIDKILYS
ncbi:MAG: hypothetical protein WC777_01265 [Candidatus Gracilibacteria bacterium]|jgi:antitoxin (DNA-binding transcriptional repressor) of toxin-antitoxin stability system